MSGKFAAIVGYICDQANTALIITDMCITSDGSVLAQHENGLGMNDFIGSARDLERNWKALLRAAELTADEYTEAMAEFKSKVKDWRKH